MVNYSLARFCISPFLQKLLMMLFETVHTKPTDWRSVTYAFIEVFGRPTFAVFVKMPLFFASNFPVGDKLWHTISLTSGAA